MSVDNNVARVEIVLRAPVALAEGELEITDLPDLLQFEKVEYMDVFVKKAPVPLRVNRAPDMVDFLADFLDPLRPVWIVARNEQTVILTPPPPKPVAPRH
jgi:hypothetical protein